VTSSSENEDICNWFQNIKAIENIDLVINQFENITNAVEFLKCYENLPGLQKVLTIILNIEADIEESTESVSQSDLNMLGKKFYSKPLIVIILRKNCDKPMIFWKSDTIGYFLSLKSYSSEDDAWMDRKMYEFILDFLIKSLRSGHLGE